MIRILELVPIHPNVHEAEHIAHEDGPQRDQRAEIGSCGTLSSSAMMVMMMAMTPSLKGSTRFLPIKFFSTPIAGLRAQTIDKSAQDIQTIGWRIG